MNPMDHASLYSALSVGSAIVVTMFTVLVVPLVRYIIKQKDDQVSSMKESLQRAFKRVDSLEEHERQTTEATKARIAELEKQLAVLQKEVSLVGLLREDIGKVSSRIDKVVAELAGLKAVMSERRPGSAHPRQ